MSGGMGSTIRNGAPVAWADVPVESFHLLRSHILDSVRAGKRVVALFGRDTGKHAREIVAVLGDAANGVMQVVRGTVGESYPTMTRECPQVHLFERQIAEEFGIHPEGHPSLAAVRHRVGQAGTRLRFQMEGDEPHQVGVGPVHAGIIEPGHFRFHCRGEEVLNLEIALGYQHRGIEDALVGGPNLRTLHYMETVAGDTSIGHALAYSQLHDGLGRAKISPVAHSLRAVALELERIANHAGDLGALAGEIGYQPTTAACGRLRGNLLNLTADLCGNRLGRGFVLPGGVRFDCDSSLAASIGARLDEIVKQVEQSTAMLWHTPSVLARFEDTGKVGMSDAIALGLVGPAARASGVSLDTRVDFPTGAYRFDQVSPAAFKSGDVFARAYIRWLEIHNSAIFVKEQLAGIGPGVLHCAAETLAPDSMCVSLVEGWRGEICHVAITDEAGMFDQYKIFDPSFHNWKAVPVAVNGEGISDFPLCNKSFNLSYCGRDL